LVYISLTFDDGMLHHYDVAKALSRAGVMATFYVPTGTVANRISLSKQDGKGLIARPDLLGEMVDMGHEVGSHTHTHRNLTMLSPDDVRLECLESVEALNRVIGSRHRARGLAYPYGLFNRAVITEVSKVFSYARAGSYHNRWNDVLNPYTVGSFGISRHMLMIPFKAALSPSRPIVLEFHKEPIPLILSIVELLRAMNLKIVPLKTSLESLGVLTHDT
jgi:peptidoglycan/xylan/chitin deacetylase (PgdA/CDA1 family)